MFRSPLARRARQGMLREWRLHMLSVFSLAVAFVCLGASLLVVTNLKSVEERWARAGKLSVYIAETLGTSEVDALKSALGAVSGVSGVRYVSSGQARQEFVKGAREELVALPVEAFPASLEVEVSADMTDADLTALVGKLEKISGVEDVETYQTWTGRLTKLVRGGLAASGLLALVVLASVFAVVGSTIRMVLHRRKTEVEVLKLVGATDRYIKGPFLLEGGAQGAMGALGAIGILAVLFLVIRSRLDADLGALLGINPTFLPWQVALGMVGLGGMLGAMAAGLGLRKLVTV
jgi:cell division transport system permease protein